MSNPVPPPGWYPDPQNPRSQRWWDGRSWGPPLDAATAPTSMPPSAPGASAAQTPAHPAVVLGTGAFVLALASLVFFWIPVVGFLLAAGALAWSIVLLTRNVRTWKSVSGTVLSSVSLVLGIALVGSIASSDAPLPVDSSEQGVSEEAPSADAPKEKDSADDSSSAQVEERAPVPKASPEAAKKGTSEDTAGSTTADQYGKQPDGERDFVRIVTDGFNSFDKADTDLQQSEAIRERNDQTCDQVGTSAEGWKGVVTGVGANGDGNAWVEIEIAPNIRVKTWNNAFSDTFDETLIPPGSTMFDNLVAMEEGDEVTFSGEFVRDADACVQTSNMTQYFSGVDPQFVMRFSSVEAR